MAAPKPPQSLGHRGRQLWRAIQGGYELSDAELQILAEACKTADLIDRLADQLAAETLVVEKRITLAADLVWIDGS